MAIRFRTLRAACHRHAALLFPPHQTCTPFRLCLLPIFSICQRTLGRAFCAPPRQARRGALPARQYKAVFLKRQKSTRESTQLAHKSTQLSHSAHLSRNAENTVFFKRRIKRIRRMATQANEQRITRITGVNHLGELRFSVTPHKPKTQCSGGGTDIRRNPCISERCDLYHPLGSTRSPTSVRVIHRSVLEDFRRRRGGWNHSNPRKINDMDILFCHLRKSLYLCTVVSHTAGAPSRATGLAGGNDRT